MPVNYLSRTVMLGLLFCCVAAAGTAASPADKIRVVASFSVLGDMAHALGGDRVDVVTLVGPDSDGHLYQPTPSDGRKISEANLVIVNGLHFEGWITRLLESAAYAGPVVVATDGVEVLYVNDEPDPHAWQSLANARVYASNIASALKALEPSSQAYFSERYDVFLRQIQEVEILARDRFGRVPPARRVVVTSHDAFGYFGRDLGIEFIAPQGISMDTEASANDVARLIRQIRADDVRAVFVENIADPRLLEQITSEAGVSIGGRLYSDALSPATGPAATYLDMMRHNIDLIFTALGAGPRGLPSTTQP